MVFQQYFWLLIASVLLFASILLERRDKQNWAILLLTLGGFSVYLFAARLCSFLNLWDEQYHAVVAKSCMQHPFVPSFYPEEILPNHDYTNWLIASVWLHKQPLFLWFIALSFKIFGVSELSLRLPSALFCALLVPIAYRIAKLLTKNERMAFCTAVAVASSWCLIRLVAGIESTDHNDVCFVFFVTASLWALLEFYHSSDHKWLWSILIGAFAGAAILTKWLVGLLVFFFWGVYELTNNGLKFRSWKLGYMLVALGVTLLIALPWQCYIFHEFPVSARKEFLYNFQHLSAEVEEHHNGLLYFLQILPLQFFGRGYDPCTVGFQWNFATILTYVILLGGLFLLFKNLKSRTARLSLAIGVLFVFLFFSFAQTKMPSFTFVLCVVGFMCIGAVMDFAVALLERLLSVRWLQESVAVIFIMLAAFYQLNYPNYYNSLYQSYPSIAEENKKVFQSWKDKVPEGYTVFNVNGFNGAPSSYCYVLNAPAMFYSDRTCYIELPPYEELKKLQSRGVKVAIVDMPGLIDTLYLNDDSFIHLPSEAKPY